MAVGFGFSLGDIIASGRLARDIYENCFTTQLASDVKYAQFRQDINLLGDGLGQLANVIKNADSQGSDKRRQDQALKVLREVTGDFDRTLRDCEALIRRHAALQHSKPGAFANFHWWNSVEPEVNRLRERVKFHIIKVTFIAKPFETSLLLGIRDDVQRVILRLDRLTSIVINDGHTIPELESITIPEPIVRRFDDAFHINCPASFKDSVHWPLKDGFDALVFHFSNSTIGFNPRPELGQNIPEPSQYLNLLKCAWIVEHLRKSSNLHEAGADSIWLDYLGRLEDGLKTEFSRLNAGHLVAPPHDVVYALTESCYFIWVEDSPPAGASGTAEQRLLEEKILEVSLPEPNAACQSSLTIFRKSDISFRRVTTTKWTDNRYPSYAEGYHIDMTSTRFIPSYANPEETSSDNYNMVLCEERDPSPTWLSLHSFADLANLQHALLGYRIHHDMSNFWWCINGSHEEGSWGRGRLQLWQPKALLEILPTNVSEAVNGRKASSPTPQLPEMGFGDDISMASISEMTRRSTSQPGGAVSAAASSSRHPDRVSVSSLTPSLPKPWSRGSTQASTPPASAMHEYVASQYRVDGISQSPQAPMLSPPLSRQSTSRSDAEGQSTRRSSYTLLTRSSITSPVNGSRGDGTELIVPELPVLIIFTISKSRYTFLQLKLEPHIIITHPRRGKTRVVLERDRDNRKKPFLVRKFTAPQANKKGLFDWDLALFRLPQRQDLSKAPLVEGVKTLDLEFESVEDKATFIDEFRELRNIWALDQNEYNAKYKERKMKSRA